METLTHTVADKKSTQSQIKKKEKGEKNRAEGKRDSGDYFLFIGFYLRWKPNWKGLQGMLPIIGLN